MKKYIFTIAAIALTTVSCTKNNPTPEPEAPATYCVASYDTSAYALSGGRQRTVSLYIAIDKGTAQSVDVDFKIKADSSLLAVYNAQHGTQAAMLPASAYKMDVTDLTVFRNNTKSLSTSVKITISHNLANGQYVLPVIISEIDGPSSASVADDAPHYIAITKTASAKGKGTKAEPYTISNKEELMDMHEYCRHESEIAAENGGDGTVYFKMIADVDLGMKEGDNNDWVPINSSEPYDRKVSFDGNGKTIKNFVSQYYNYPSFLGVVYGEVYNVIFDSSVIIGESAIGTIGGYGGTSSSGGRTAYIHNVHVKNGKVIQNPSENKGIGGLIGRMYGSKIEACSFDGYIESSYNMIGGIIGQDTKLACEIVNCSSSGRINILHGQRAGGIAGCLTIAGSSIKNCFSSMTVEGRLAAGGIVGHANLDSSSPQTPNNVFSKCIAWNDKITAMGTEITQYSSGAVAGFCAKANTCTDCYYRRDMNLEFSTQTLNDYFALVDQPNCDAQNPQSVGVEYVTSGSNKRYKLPYNGKASAIGQTASQIASILGWDTAIWNLTTDIPVLR